MTIDYSKLGVSGKNTVAEIHRSNGKTYARRKGRGFEFQWVKDSEKESYLHISKADGWLEVVNIPF